MQQPRVGYGPALDLSPLLTLRPAVTLVDNPDTGHTSEPTFEVRSAADIPVIAAEVVTLILEQAPRFATRFTTALEIGNALRPDPAAAPVDDPDDPRPPHRRDPRPKFHQDWLTTRRLVLLAVTGAHDDARALLADFPAFRNGPKQDINEHDRRFIRQLTRWLDAGGPTPPPLAETLAVLPHPELPHVPSVREALATSRRRSALGEAALDATRRRARTADHDALPAIVAEEHTRRGIPLAQSEVLIQVELLHREQQRFGQARISFTALRVLRSSAASLLGAITSEVRATASVDTARPERASFPATTGTGPWVTVQPDSPASDWSLTDLESENSLTVGPYQLVDVWLTQPDPAEAGTTAGLVAHIGPHRVGTLPDEATAALTPTTRAAALFDEDPWTPGRILRLDGTALLEIRVPPPAP